MKIGFVYDMIYPFSKGGAEKRIYHLASRLATRHEVHCVGLKQWEGPSTVVTDAGVTLHGVRRPPGRVYVDHGRRALLEPVWFGVALFQWMGLRNMDLIDCSSFPYFSTFSARALAILGRKPLVTTWHEFWGDYWNQYAPRVAPIGRVVEKMAVWCSMTVVAVSEHTRQKLINTGLKTEQVSVIPNGIDMKAIERAEPLLDAPDILFVGRLIREKKVGELLEALSRQPLDHLGATCWIVGEGSDREYLQRRVTELGLGSRVSFVSWMPEEQVYGAMKGAKVVALLSEREGFGMVVLEAMACGTPVVVASGRHTAAPDLVRSGENGYVVPCEPQAVSEALASIITSPGLRASLGARGKERAVRFDWDLITEHAEAVYLRAAGMTS